MTLTPKAASTPAPVLGLAEVEGALLGGNEGTIQSLTPEAKLLTPITPEATCSVFARITFSWLSPLLQRGATKPLVQSDLYRIESANSADTLLRAYDDASDEEKEPQSGVHSLAWRMWRTVAREQLTRSVPPMLLFVACQVAQPLLLHGTVTSVRNRSADGVWYALGILIVTLLGSCANQAQLHICYRVGQRLRALTTANVVRHVLALPLCARRDIPSGELVNLVTSDAQKLYELVQQANLLWAAPLQIAIIAVFLVRLLGPAALLGIAYLALGAPLSRRIVAVQKHVRQQRMPLSDARVGLCSEVIRGMRTVKAWHWESPFARRVLQARRSEAPLQRHELWWWAWSLVVVVTAPTVAMGLTFTAVTLSGRVLTAADAFTALLFFNNVKFPMMFVGQMLSTIAQSTIALKRLNSLLRRTGPTTQQQPPVDSQTALPTSDSASASPKSSNEKDRRLMPCVELQGATFNLTKAFKTTTTDDIRVVPNAESNSSAGTVFGLRDISITVQPGELVMVVGPVGSGKTTLLHALLGELALQPTDDGGSAILRTKKVAYAAQSPFVLSATVRQNILFGLPFDRERYTEVIEACALKLDLALMPNGDATVIGERGVTLSGGQKHRISLARAAYARPELVLLDDPLSALDAHVGKEILENLIGGGLKQDATGGLLRAAGAARVLVTHANQYLAHADQIIAMYEGRIAFTGTFEQLVSEVDAHTPQGAQVVQCNSSHIFLQGLAKSVQEAKMVSPSSSMTQELVQEQTQSEKQTGSHATASSAPVVVEEKHVQRTTTDWRVWWHWVISAGGLPVLLVQVVLLGLDRASYAALDFWIAKWTLAAEHNNTVVVYGHTLPHAVPDERWYLHVYLGIVALNAVFVISRSHWFSRAGWRASQRIFERLLSAVLRAPLTFFESNPFGRIINRFSLDTEVIDYMLVVKICASIISFAWFITALVVMSSIIPYLLLVLVPVLLIYYRFQLFFRRSNVELQRLDASSRSPVQAQFMELVDGAVTIRAMQRQSLFLQRLSSAIDTNTAALTLFSACNRWLGLRLDLLGSIVAFAAALLCSLLRNSLEPGLAGMAVLWAFIFLLSINFLVVETTEAEALLVSLERVLQYVQLPQEEFDLLTDGSLGTAAALAVAGHEAMLPSPPPAWPSTGEVEFRGIRLRYRPGLPAALDDFCLRAAPHQRVGIVGRTGAGKSTVAAALFRLVQPEAGSILVDGIDILRLGLDDARSRAACLIPQDPWLFSGSIRANVDPFEQFEDEMIWEALDAARLGHVLREAGIAPGAHGNHKGAGLQAHVDEGGANFSAGQRQLVCLARALLRKPRILVMDEASASVDRATDSAIQATIRQNFRGSTIFTIAHRLETICDYDLICVIAEGRVIEVGPPAALLEQGRRSAFAAMVDSAGEEAAAHLRALACGLSS